MAEVEHAGPQDEHWHCACGAQAHFLSLLWDERACTLSVCDELRFLETDRLSVHGWQTRLRAVWRVLTVGQWDWAEVILDARTAREMAMMLHAAADHMDERLDG